MLSHTPLTLDDFDYDLPPELIAQHPAAERGGSRLLCLAHDTLSDRMFADLPQLLSPGDLLVFNDTRVIKARLYGQKESGGRIEMLVERVLGAHEALAHIRASHAPRAGAALLLDGDVHAEVLGREGDLYHLRFGGDDSLFTLLERHGKLPLPPYITHPADSSDESRYQTVYARDPGAVAAPTAGLHFDEAMLARLRNMGVELAWVTLHVGAGTFQPVRENDLSKHQMHVERFDIPVLTAEAIARARAAGRKITAVGTTSMRALEAAASRGMLQVGRGQTDLFITPGYRFRVVDRLLTNFHLPKSTLLMLISAFAGMAPVRDAYAHAIAARYRFFSYGDAMLIDRAATPA
jgi:S-adenosylmethionine:tRNA ribosyltransferase-isomerase